MLRLRTLIFVALLVSTVLFAERREQAPGPVVHYVTSPDLSPASGYSHAAVVSGGRTIYISGQTGLTKAGEMIGRDDFKAQATQAFKNLQAALAAAGGRPENIVKLNFYVVDLGKERLGTLRAVRDTFIDQKHPPASTLAGVQALFREDASVEIDAIAVVP